MIERNDTSKAKRGRPKSMKKHADILGAAAETFMAKGFVGTTMDEIAAAAGVSKLTVYNHFGTKEALFCEVIHHKCDQFTGEQLFFELQGRDPEKELTKIGCAFIDLIFSPEAIAMHRMMIADGAHSHALGELFYQAGPQRLYQRLVTYLGRIEQHSAYHFPDKAKSATLFFDMFKGDAHMRALLHIPPHQTTEELYANIPELVTFFLRGHRAVP